MVKEDRTLDWIESTLMELWSEVLGIKKDKITVASDFFQLGGHSLKATIMATKIYEVFQVTVPLIEIFRSPTIKDIANYIELMEEAKKSGSFPIINENLVLLNIGTDREKHLFLVHDGTGEIDKYVGFSKHLDRAFNIWGIRLARFEDNVPEILDIKEIASLYVSKIKNVQPLGPYNIAGWSLGGTIAFEMIRQLEEKGEAIGFATLIDCTGPRRKITTQTDRFRLMEEMEWMEEKLPGMDIDPRLTAVLRTLVRARGYYVPDNKVSVKINYFDAKDSREAMGNRWLYWINQPFNQHALEGGHFSIFNMPYVREFAKIFNELLTQKEEE
ncbi:MAG: hypothetical protein GY940_09900 [bacterium]|nr:hypothetical protein [bacterium]